MTACFVSRLSLFVVLVVAAAVAQAETLAYHWQQGQKFSYEFQIQVDAGDETISYNGMTHYTVKNSGPKQSNISYRGGLKETKTSKRVNRGGRFGGPFGPRGFRGRPSFPSPFSRPTFTGKTQTNNEITISTRGQTLAMKGDSQLPYLLGNVSLMPFEMLPASDQRQWTLDSGVSITEESENSRDRFGPFGPRGPFGSGSDDKNVQSAGETANYSIQSDDGKLVVIEKTYRLDTPQTEDNPAFDMTGTGTWTFDRQENVPHAYDMNFKLTIKKGNTQTVVPISVKYNRVSAEKIAAMEAEAKRKADERAKAEAEKKALAETPLTPQETSSALAALGSGDGGQIKATLAQLASKSLQDPDPSVAAAIESHLQSEDKSIRDAAHKAMLKWSPAYARKKSLAKAYQGPAVLKSTGLAVESTTPLYEGQLVQAQKPRFGSFWRAAKVKKLLPDGRVELAFLTWGKERDSAAVDRRAIQLAPPELEQPAKPAVVAAPTTGGSRTWSDLTGKFKVDATFVSLDSGTVTLRRADGKTLSVPFNKLSLADQKFVEQQQEAENPFKLN